MRKILALITGLLFMTGMLVSCLESEEIELSSHAYILSFSINDIKTEIPSKTSAGKDTTLVRTTYGRYYTFAIDHVAGEVYNVDSLPKGTDVTRVTVNMGLNAGYAYYYQGDEAKIFSTEDSIDFTNPVRFTVFAADGEGSRSYLVRLNVHQTDVDSLVWTRVENNNFHGGRMTAEKMVQLRNQLMVFGEMDGVPTIMGGNLGGDFNYAKKEWPLMINKINHLLGVDYSSIVSHENAVYLLADGKLYSSIEGVNWTAESPERTFTSMLGVVDGKLYLNEGGAIVACDPYEWTTTNRVETLTHDWETVQTVDETLLPVNPSVVTMPLRTNTEIVRTTLIGTPHADAGKEVSIWTKLSTDPVWTYYSPVAGNDKGCPLLERLTVIGDNNKLYAFGGASKDGKLEAFEAIYTSTDGGLTWLKQKKQIGFPTELKGYNEPFACVKDATGTIWLQCSDGRLFCGRIGK